MKDISLFCMGSKICMQTDVGNIELCRQFKPNGFVDRSYICFRAENSNARLVKDYHSLRKSCILQRWNFFCFFGWPLGVNEANAIPVETQRYLHTAR
jgi:hypothetical protein